MKSQWKEPSAVRIIAVGGLALSVAVGCKEDRQRFDRSESFAAIDAGSECLYQCSIDGRSRLTVCNGAVTETEACPPELACGGGVCQEPCAAAGADRSSNGCEFYLQAPRYSKIMTNNQSCYAAFVVNTSTQDAIITLEYQGQSLDLSKSLFRTAPASMDLLALDGPLPPGESALLFVSDRDRTLNTTRSIGVDLACPEGVVPASFADVIPNGTGVGASFHLSSNVPVSLASIYPFGGASSQFPAATLHLPVSSWEKEHIIVSGWENGRWASPATAIVASEDDTEITLLPKVDLQNGADVVGVPAKTPWKFRLGKGQNVQLVQAHELTGSVLTANKPVGIFGGHGCVNVPTDRTACDVLNQQIPAFQQWGSEYVGVGYRPRQGNEHEPVGYRIIAAMDGTRLEYDPPEPPAGAPVTLSAGELKLFYAGTGDPFVVRSQDADHPIYLAAYMTGGSDYAGMGDPEFLNVVPTGQYLNSYAFYADPTFSETSLVIVRAKNGGRWHDVWLECAGNLTEFHPIGTGGEYEYTRVDLSREFGTGDKFDSANCQVGLQRMRSDGPFSASLWGWGAYASYAYASGMALRQLVPGQLALPH